MGKYIYLCKYEINLQYFLLKWMCYSYQKYLNKQNRILLNKLNELCQTSFKLLIHWEGGGGSSPLEICLQHQFSGLYFLSQNNVGDQFT